jgi:hypothetical protein
MARKQRKGYTVNTEKMKSASDHSARTQRGSNTQVDGKVQYKSNISGYRKTHSANQYPSSEGRGESASKYRVYLRQGSQVFKSF